MRFQIFGFKFMFESFVLLFLVVIPATASLQDSGCSGSQITWIDNSGQVIGCSPCPACPTGSEYSIPCSTKAINGTPANCIACPPGKFSNGFNDKPCVACTRCSKRYTKRICTPLKNAECGGCIAGYYYNKVSFGCEECGRCCKDGKDQLPLGCARVGMCKARPNGCPDSISGTSKKPTGMGWSLNSPSNMSRLSTHIKKNPKTPPFGTSSLTTFKSRKLHLTKFINKTSSTPNPVKKVDEDFMNNMPRDEEEGTGLQTLVQAAVGLLIVTIILLIAVIIVKVYTHHKRSKRPVLIRSTSYATNPFKPEPSPEDRTLEDFVEHAVDAVESVCILLYDQLKKGMWDFERVALRFGLSQEERISIRSSINTTGENPTRELMRVLCSKRPKITVKQFAEIVKNIKRNDVYEKLEPFFFK